MFKILIFIIGILITIAGVATCLSFFKEDEHEERVPLGLRTVVVVLGLVAIGLSSIYSQDVGEVVVLRSLGGNLAGSTTDAGFHFTAPWNDVITFDTRNNLINFYGKDTEYSYDGGSAEGPCVTVNDKSGSSANVDIQINYSLDPKTAEYLYTEYGTQENFTKNYAANDLRSVAREVSGQFDTITMLTDRAQYTKAVQKALEKKWSKIGLTVEQVSVQDISYAKSITDAYADSQAAEVEKAKAQNQQETAKIKGETKVIEATKEAEANRVLNESLTDNVLTQEYIDALKEMSKNGNTVVVPQGSTPVVNTK